MQTTIPPHNAELREWLRQNELRLYLSGTSISMAQLDFTHATNYAIPPEEFEDAIRLYCRLWMRGRVNTQSIRKNLDDVGWERLKQAVVDLRDYLQGLPLDDAVKVVCSRVSCNRELLSGLPGRLRVWRGN